MRGPLTPCCRSGYSYGNWNEIGLREAWSSERAQQFRKKVIDGEFPTSDCLSCYQKGTAITLARILRPPLHKFLRNLSNFSRDGIWRIRQIETIFDKTELDDEAVEKLAAVRALLATHMRQATAENGSPEYEIAVRKLGVILNATESFLRGDLVPEEVAPVRQANIVAVCNARCVQCPFLTTGEIIKGVPMPDGSHKKQMESEEIDATFSCASSVIDFFLNGSEFFLIRDWQSVARRLKENGVQFRISTNGMLLNEFNVRAICENRYAGRINISIDGARPETIEKIRQRVKFATLKDNLRFFFAHLKETEYFLTTSFSYCLMKDNLDELPEVIETVKSFAGGSFDYVKPMVLIQPLEMRGTKAYLDFAKEQHVATVDSARVVRAFQQLRDSAIAHDVTVGVFHRFMLDDFISQGCPVPMPESVLVPDGLGILDAPDQ
jgi:molybdenum cofactor biosynthesis enzyme MoaA